MSFDAIEKYNTRLLIPRKTGMFATVAVHVQRESPLTSCALFQGRLAGPIFIHKICFRLCTCRFIFSLRGRRLKF